MFINLTDQECDYLKELLEAAHIEKIHELHHTDLSDYKRILREKVRIIEELMTKLTLQRVSA
jgi:hypothetical protein